MARLRFDSVKGELSATIAPTDTVINSPGLARLGNVSGGDVALVCLFAFDNNGNINLSENVYVTNHAIGSTSAIVTRAGDGTTAQSWPVLSAWAHGWGVADVAEIQASISAETTRATNAEAGLSTSITAEQTRATNAEGVLTTNLATEVTRATTAEALRMYVTTRTSVKTSTYGASVGDLVPVNTTSGAVTVQLPNGPAQNSVVSVVKVAGSNNVTVACQGSDVLGNTGGVTTYTVSNIGQLATFQYDQPTKVWTNVADAAITGSQGAQGPQGYQGSTGPQGTQGAVGSQGPQGYQGNIGFQGTQGNQGYQGSQGSQGSQGPQGSFGTQGYQGYQGFQGAQGVQGSQGNQGTQGAQGSQGNQGYPVGLTGATTATRYVGGTTNGAPTSGTFAVGDFIVDQTGTIWVCTTAGTPGTWTTTISSHLSLRTASATVGRNEITIFSGSTASQTLTAPSNPIDGSNWSVINKASVAVTLSFTPSMVPLSSGTGVTTFSVPAGGAYSFLNYNGSQWYMISTNSADQLINVLPTANGGTGLSTIGTAGQALVVNGGATGLTYTSVTGTQGAQGAQGAQGSQGNQGTQGNQGYQGATGTGTQGNQGAQGSQGASGGGSTVTQATLGTSVQTAYTGNAQTNNGQRFVSGYTNAPSNSATFKFTTFTGPTNTHGQGCIDNVGNIYFVDNSTTTAAIYKVTPSGGAITSIATVTTSATANSWQIIYDSVSGNLYATCRDATTGGGIYRLTTTGASLTKILTYSSTTASPLGIAVDSSGNLFYLNGGSSGSGTLYKSTNPTAGSPTFSSFATNASFATTGPANLCIDSANNLYYADATTTAIWKVTSAAVVTQWGVNGTSYNNVSFFDNVNQVLYTNNPDGTSVGSGVILTNGVAFPNKQYSLYPQTSAVGFAVADTIGNIYFVNPTTIYKYPGVFHVGDVITDSSKLLYVCQVGTDPVSTSSGSGPYINGTWQSITTYANGAAGAIPYSNGTTQTQLAIGGAGGLLTVNSGATAPTWTAIGTQGQVLTSTGTAPSWATLPSFTSPPNLNAFKAWAADPAVVTLSSAPSSSMAKGIGFYSAAYLTAGTIISNVYINIATAGVGLSNCYVGLFNATTRVAVSAAISTAWQTTGAVSNAFAASYLIQTTGIYYVAILFGNGSTTAPILSSTPGTTGLFNINTSASSGTLATSRMVSLGSGLTALPTSISGTPATGGYNFWWSLY